MGQFGLLINPVLVVLNLLSGSTTPMESITERLQHAMQVMPTPHFVSFAQAVLYPTGFEIVSPPCRHHNRFFGVSPMRFRTTIASFQ